jgi:hypothetical protein
MLKRLVFEALFWPLAIFPFLYYVCRALFVIGGWIILYPKLLLLRQAAWDRVIRKVKQ